MEGTDDEGAIHLLINPKCTMVVVETLYPNRNTPHSMSPGLFETNARDYQYKTEDATDQYL